MRACIPTLLFLALSLSLGGCGGDDAPADTGGPDAVVDSSTPDTSPPPDTGTVEDTGPAEADTGPPDTGPACPNVLDDLGGACLSDAVEVTTPNPEAPYPAAVWTGSELGIVWLDQHEGEERANFSRVGSDGTVLSSVPLTTTPARRTRPAIAWSGTEFVTVFREDERIALARVSADGSPIGGPVQLTEDEADAAHAGIAWHGSGYGVAWSDGRGTQLQTYFAALDESATKLTGDIPLPTTRGRAWRQTITYNGTSFMLAWMEDAGSMSGWVINAFLDTDGTILQPPAEVSGVAWVARPKSYWTGTDHAVLWSDNRGGTSNVYMRRYGPSGAAVADEVAITAATTSAQEGVVAVADGRTFVFWREAGSIWAAELGAADEIILGPAALWNQLLSPSFHSAHFDGERFLLLTQTPLLSRMRTTHFRTLEL